MLKFFHIGDVHLDTKFHSRNNKLRNKLRDGIRESFSKGVDICIEEKVNALLIAGDLFDNDRLSFKTEQFLIKEFNRLRDKNIRVFYATGNHDPGAVGYRANSIKWPSNVTVFKKDMVEDIYIRDLNNNKICRIISCGHNTNREHRNLIEKFPIKKEDIVHIGLVHTMITNASGVKNHDRYLPCTKEDLESKMYDYWALGHIHNRQKVSENHEIHYPGNIQGRNPKETDKKGGILVTLDNQRVETHFIPLSTIEWRQFTLRGLEDIKNYGDLKTHISTSIELFLKENNLIGSELILRIELEGRAYLKNELQLDEDIQFMIEDLILDFNLLDLELKTDNLMKFYEIDEYKEGNHVLSTVLTTIENLERNEELMDRIFSMELANRKIKTKDEKLDYFRELIKDLEEAAVERMVGAEDENI